MSIQLVGVLAVLLVANQILGTSYGCWKEGFKWDLFLRGVWKIVHLAVGYGAIAVAAKWAAEYVPAAEYLSGILVEPIAKYFSKICESLRNILDDSVKEIIDKTKEKE